MTFTTPSQGKQVRMDRQTRYYPVVYYEKEIYSCYVLLLEGGCILTIMRISTSNHVAGIIQCTYVLPCSLLYDVYTGMNVYSKISYLFVAIYDEDINIHEYRYTCNLWMVPRNWILDMM